MAAVLITAMCDIAWGKLRSMRRVPGGAKPYARWRAYHAFSAITRTEQVTACAYGAGAASRPAGVDPIWVKSG